MTEPTEGTTTKQPETTDATAAGDGPGQPAPTTFTQDQLDTILKERLARATSTATADILADLGIEDLATARQTLAEAETTRKAQMTELEKAKAEIAEIQAKAALATTEAETIKAQATKDLLKAAIISRAVQFEDPMDAWTFIDQTKIEAQDDGTYKGIDEALKALIEVKPYLVKTDDGTPGPGTPARTKPKSIVEKLLEKNHKQQGGEQPRRSTVKF